MYFRSQRKRNNLLVEEKCKIKYGLKKLNVGVASCIVGCAIFFSNFEVTVQAAEEEDTSITVEDSTVENVAAVEVREKSFSDELYESAERKRGTIIVESESPIEGDLNIDMFSTEKPLPRNLHWSEENTM